MLALGVFIVIVTAGIDLSVGSILMLSLMVLAITSKAGAAWYVVILIPIVMGALCGMVNGLGNNNSSHAPSFYNDIRYALYI